jgi:hypothetical protein
MAYYPDLAPYAYGHRENTGVVHVGWLDGVHPLPKGTLDRHLLEKIKALAAKPVELYRGKHICELCANPPNLFITFIPGKGKFIDPNDPWWQWAEQRSGNGEIRVSREGVTFAAPVLVVHYIEEHGHLPPPEFLEAVEEAVC